MLQLHENLQISEMIELAIFVIGILSTSTLVYQWIKVSLMGIISWNKVYKEIDKFIKTYKNDYGENINTIVTLGFGGSIIGAYIIQFFPRAEIVHVEVERNVESDIRELDRWSLEKVKGDNVLLVSGVHDTGWVLSTAQEYLKRTKGRNLALTSYAFLLIPQSDIQEIHDSSFTKPDYYSIRKKKARLPWYITRLPATPTLPKSNNEINILVRESAVDIKNLSLDLNRSLEKYHLFTPAISNLIAEYIRSEALNNYHYNVVIAGPAAIGKSTLAELLCSKIPDSTYLPLDSSVNDTSIRDVEMTDGCQIESYDLSKVQEWLDDLEAEKEFIISPFDHATRSCVGKIKVNGKCKTRIIEWVFALSEEIRLRKNFTIILDTTDKARFEYWLERFTDIRKQEISDYTIKAVKKRFDNTKLQIDPTLKFFDIRFILNESRHITRIDCNLADLNRILKNKF